MSIKVLSETIPTIEFRRLEAVELRKNNIDCNDINHIIISHFHADHVGGLKDFQNAQLHVSQVALDHVNNISKSLAFSKGVLTDLIPSDLNLSTDQRLNSNNFWH